VLALLGRSIPGNVRVLLLALAIIDDIVAVLIIAIVYSGGLDLSGLLVCGLDMAARALGELTTGNVGAPHDIAGPLKQLRQAQREVLPPVIRVQMALHPWVAFGVMPLFALANAGVTIDGVDLSLGDAQTVTLGVVLALVLGKPLGVVAASWLAVRLGWCRLPPGVNCGSVVLVGLLAGIGFTMSIFIATPAFVDAKLGVLLASLVAAVLGLSWGFLQAVRARRSAARA